MLRITKEKIQGNIEDIYSHSIYPFLWKGLTVGYLRITQISLTEAPLSETVVESGE